jgi:hypothetical protein
MVDLHMRALQNRVPVLRGRPDQRLLSGLNLVPLKMDTYHGAMKKWLGAVACPLVLVACGGGGGGGGSTLPSQPTTAPSGVPTSGPTPTTAPTTAPTTSPLPASTLPPQVNTAPGDVNGAAGILQPIGPNNPKNQSSIDGIPCATVMYNTFHVHAYLGIIVNGSWLADPTAMGMVNPGPASAGFVNSATCFYWIHMHDSSGYVHMESPNYEPVTSSEFTLGNVMDVWGETLSSTQFGPWSGMVRIFTATAPAGSQIASGYTEYTGTPDALQLYSHEAIWIEVNPPYTTQLPPVQFYSEY